MNTANPIPKARVLYVDDDRENLSSFKAMFRRDYDVFLASSAMEGLEILRSTEIQVLITDQRMPGMEGTELLEMAAVEFPKTRRFLLTAFSDFPPLVKAINNGKLQGYFSKPIDGNFIRSRIEEGLKNYYLEIENIELIEKVRQSETFLNAIVENIPDMIFVKDAENLRFVRFNKAGEELLGYPREEMIGKTDHDFFPFELADFFVKKDQETLSGGQLVDIPEETIETRYKGRRLLHTKKIPILNEEGRPAYLLGISRDLTEQRELEGKKKELEAKLNRIQKMESIGTLAGGIAHDFNNILAAIIGYTELAMMDIEGGKQPLNSLRAIYTAGERARDLVRQILTFARQSEEKIMPIRVDGIAREVMKLIRSSIPTTIEIRQKIETDSIIMGSPTQIHQVLMNLCTNAAHAMEENGGVLDVTISKIVLDDSGETELEDMKPGKYVKIMVADTGCGMAPDIMELIFEPYFTTKGPSEGTGMGLAMVYGIVKSCGGKIKVASEPGRGSVFTLFLPGTEQGVESKSPMIDELPRGRERILVVDDEQALTMMVSELLQHLGYQVSIGTDGMEALELFRRDPNQFDLVMTDMTMPGITGDILAMELLRIRPDLPVILCTGYSRKISEERSPTVPIKALLHKPIVMKDLAHTIRKILDETKEPGKSSQ
ncbi:MAG: response regulator [Thermodesulfobacteriota bacterium]